MKTIFATLFGVIALSFMQLAHSGKVSYDGYAVFRLITQEPNHLKILEDLEDKLFDFWVGPSTKVGGYSDLLLSPEDQKTVLKDLQDAGIIVEEYVKNVESLILKENVTPESVYGLIDWESYYRYDAIYAWMDSIASNHSAIASTFSIGTSFEGRDLRAIKISKSNETKPAIFLDSNIHAREWATSAVITYLINELLTSNDTTIQSWVEDFDWYFVPILNPDGFHFSHDHDRLWRKTRSNTSTDGCIGVDGNRNFDFCWKCNGPPSLSNPCASVYAGPKPFSEPETRALRNFLTSISDRLVFYSGVHTYGLWILIPFGHENDKIPQYNTYMRIGQAAAEAHARRYGSQYVPGNVVDLLYVAPGESFDWVKGVLNTNLTYIYELRDKGEYGFLLPADQIIPSALEFMDGLEVIVDELRVGIPEIDP